MTPEDYARCDATDLMALIASGQVTREEVFAVADDLLGDLGGRLNFLAFPTAVADRPSGGSIPTLIKDIGGHIAGHPWRSGSRLYEGDVCRVGSYVGQALCDAGAVVMGSSTAPEFSLEAHVESDLFGRTFNPWEPRRSPGGSSGGAAAAVASGAVPVAHASDIAGSIRLPAAWCGLVGLKPSRGRVSAGPMREEAGFGLASNFVVTRTVRDAAFFMDAFARPRAGDPYALPLPADGYAARMTAPSPAGLRIALTAPSGTEAGDLTVSVAKTLEDMGHSVTPLDNALPDSDALMALAEVWHGGFDRLVETAAAQRGITDLRATLGPTAFSAYQHARTIDLPRFLDAQAHLNSVRRRIAARLSPYDIWLTPTAPGPAPLWDDVTPIAHDDPFRAHIDDKMAPVFAYTFVHNILGTPALSLPLGLTAGGLPLGVQIGAKPAREDLLIGLARDLEAALPWAGRQPAIHATNKADA